MATFDEFYESLPEDSNKRGEYFEKVFVPWFLKTDPEWSSQVKEVWLWDDYPHRWGKDCGIDLVYEDRQGNHWAVQSKCVSPDREISGVEIDSFLSESSDSKVHGRQLMAEPMALRKTHSRSSTGRKSNSSVSSWSTSDIQRLISLPHQETPQRVRGRRYVLRNHTR